MSQLYPEVVDTSTITGVFTQDTFLGIGIEGQMDNAGTATVGTPYNITSLADADTLFGPSSSLSALVKFVLNQGASLVVAVPSKKGSTPLLADRQAAWAPLENERAIRIRLTDSVTQADLVALADSAEFANAVQNKQYAFVGMASGTSKATLLTAATAILSKRGVLAAPGVYNNAGTLLSGAYAAAAIAVEVAKNPNLADDLDTLPIPGLSGIEKAANGTPIFMIRANGGSPTNDFEDLLQGGASPIRQGWNGGAEITHLRTTFTTDETGDALVTIMIEDHIFILIRDMAEARKYLRLPNNEEERGHLAEEVNQILIDNNELVQPIIQPNGTLGYGVSVTSEDAGHTMKIAYSGLIVRNTQKIKVNGSLQIPVGS